MWLLTVGKAGREFPCSAETRRPTRRHGRNRTPPAYCPALPFVATNVSASLVFLSRTRWPWPWQYTAAAASQPSRPSAARSGITMAGCGAPLQPRYSSSTRVGAESAMNLRSPFGPAAPRGSAAAGVTSWLSAVVRMTAWAGWC
ncbi:hypothetical protein PAHAL_5G165800 [Panicum hallii]|jgi:hypothetical protein|uniref:Uncharacterized protein n=1 Tax=Panicum hallii TaxID=206008 RepID=A0A2T8IK70_9POAL|nr:hypothetical protein PAHAL_5G165800 [Panicum hallii]